MWGGGRWGVHELFALLDLAKTGGLRDVLGLSLDPFLIVALGLIVDGVWTNPLWPSLVIGSGRPWAVGALVAGKYTTPSRTMRQFNSYSHFEVKISDEGGDGVEV